MHLFRRIHVYILAYFRPWAYEAHISDKHIDKLWELIELVFADEIAGTCDTWIMPADSDEFLLIGSYLHRAELIDTEILIMPSHSHLTIENRSR